MTAPDRPYSIEQLARRWQVAPGTVYAMVRRGDLKAFRAGKSPWRVSAMEVARHETGGECGSNSTGASGAPSPEKAEKPSGGLSELRIVRSLNGDSRT
ncbi:MAG: helix-turn-helix domain-containing protein [Patescibacteria group bacterium]|nr:helix-turn-helix domain-containing protein [Patescibacteria group bacterium]